MNEPTWKTSSSKEEKFNQLWKGIKEMKETMLTQNGELKKQYSFRMENWTS